MAATASGTSGSRSKKKIEIFLDHSSDGTVAAAKYDIQDFHVHRRSFSTSQNPPECQKLLQAPDKKDEDLSRKSICIGTEEEISPVARALAHKGGNAEGSQRRKKMWAQALSGIIRKFTKPVRPPEHCRNLNGISSENTEIAVSSSLPLHSRHTAADYLSKLLRKTKRNKSPPVFAGTIIKPQDRNKSVMAHRIEKHKKAESPNSIGRMIVKLRVDGGKGNRISQECYAAIKPEQEQKQETGIKLMKKENVSFRLPETKGTVFRVAKSRSKYPSKSHSPACQSTLRTRRTKLPRLELRNDGGTVGLVGIKRNEGRYNKPPLEFDIGGGNRKFNTKMKFLPISDGYRILLANNSAEQDSIIPTTHEIKVGLPFISY